MRLSQLFLKSRGYKSQLMFFIYCFYICETCQCNSYLDWWFAIAHIYNFVAYQFYVFVQSTDASLCLNLCMWWEVRLYKLSHYYLVMPYGVSNFCRCRFRKYSVAPITCQCWLIASRASGTCYWNCEFSFTECAWKCHLQSFAIMFRSHLIHHDSNLRALMIVSRCKYEHLYFYME